MERVVLDTNIVLVSLSEKSHCHWVFSELRREKYELYLSNDILNEYIEILDSSSNVFFVESYFRFNLLSDPDDNKFVDCAIAAKASCLVSEDKGFRVLKKINFPKIKLLGLNDFKKILGR